MSVIDWSIQLKMSSISVETELSELFSVAKATDWSRNMSSLTMMSTKQ